MSKEYLIFYELLNSQFLNIFLIFCYSLNLKFKGLNMLKCPLCGATAIKEQPEPSLHAFTTIFECGTKIDQAFNASDWTYAQKCNEPIIKYHINVYH